MTGQGLVAVGWWAWRASCSEAPGDDRKRAVDRGERRMQVPLSGNADKRWQRGWAKSREAGFYLGNLVVAGHQISYGSPLISQSS